MTLLECPSCLRGHQRLITRLPRCQTSTLRPTSGPQAPEPSAKRPSPSSTLPRAVTPPAHLPFPPSTARLSPTWLILALLHSLADPGPVARQYQFVSQLPPSVPQPSYRALGLVPARPERSPYGFCRLTFPRTGQLPGNQQHTTKSPPSLRPLTLTDQACHPYLGPERMAPAGAAKPRYFPMAEGYCVKCKTKKEIAEAVEETLKNGRKAIKGKCPTCGTVMFKMLGGRTSSSGPANPLPPPPMDPVDPL